MFWLILTTFSWISGILLYRNSIETLGYNGTDNIHNTIPSNPVRNATISSKPEGIFYFVQISDLHISAFRHSMGIEHLKSFLSTELPFLSPEKTIVTGDLTDAKSRFKLSSSQFEQEWVEYHDALLDAGVFSVKDFWLDQRGNHDCFDVAGFNHPSNHFKLFSSIKKEGYAIHMKKDFGTYSFVGVDGCPKYGTRRPLNFFGYLDKDDMDFIEESIQSNANHTFVMSHYPSGTLVKGLSSKGFNFDSLTTNVTIWFSGHLHNLIGGLGDRMFHRTSNGYLELELGDMKVNKMYRIVAVDNDMISFRDLSLTSKSYETIDPIILITYPKDGRFKTNNEPASVLRDNSYIRFLLWKRETQEVSFLVSIDGIIKANLIPVYSGVGTPWKNKNISIGEAYLPLWTIQWDPSEYNDGLEHTLTVKVIGGSTKLSDSALHRVNFRYDGKVIEDMDSGSGGFIISVDFNKFFKIMFVLGYLLLFFGLLVLPKLWVKYLKRTRSYKPWKTTVSRWILKSEMQNKRSVWGMALRIIYRWILRLCNMASSQSRIWTFYFVYTNLIICFPWFLGDFVPSSQDASTRWGLSFVYGILFLDGTWIPLLDSWAYSTFSLFGTIIPFYLYFSCWYEPLEMLFSPENSSRLLPIHRRWYVAFLIVSLWLYSALDTFLMIFYYGKWAILFNQRTWFLIFIAQNMYNAWRNANFLPLNNSEVHDTPDRGISLSRKDNSSHSSYNLRSRSVGN